MLMDEGAEPAAEGSFEDDVIYETILEDLIAMLSEIKPKYGRIFRLLYDGATQQEMADELGIKQRTVSDDTQEDPQSGAAAGKGHLQPLKCWRCLSS
ncbi:MAG: RNA polymerase sigma factor [Oscillospiraceae bacterium]